MIRGEVRCHITMEAKFLATKGSLGNDSGNANENGKKK